MSETELSVLKDVRRILKKILKVLMFDKKGTKTLPAEES